MYLRFSLQILLIPAVNVLYIYSDIYKTPRLGCFLGSEASLRCLACEGILVLSLSFVPFDPDLFLVQPIDGGEVWSCSVPMSMC